MTLAVELINYVHGESQGDTKEGDKKESERKNKDHKATSIKFYGKTNESTRGERAYYGNGSKSHRGYQRSI